MNSAQSQTPFILPDSAFTKNGIAFNPKSDVWRFSSSSHYIKICFDSLRGWATPALVNSIKAALIGEAKRLAALTVEAIMQHAITSLFRHSHSRTGVCADRITLGMVQAFARALDHRHKYELTWVKTLANALRIHGDPSHGIEDEAVRWLHKQRIPPNPKGEAVLTMDPIKGPLLLSEDRLLMSALHAALEANEVPVAIYIRILLYRLSGMRGAQIADLKVKDLTFRDGVYYLAFPRAKKRGEGWRETFETWAMQPEVGAMLAGFIQLEKTRWAQLGMGDDLPLFVNSRRNTGCRDPIRAHHLVGNTLASDLPRYLSNLKAPDPITRLPVRICSPRTGEPFRINMKRFRSSMATWALQKGATLLELALILGHAGVSPSLNCYTAIDVGLLEENDRKMASSEVRAAGYFSGELLNEALATGTKLYPDRFDGEAVGTCRGICAQRKPHACYSCRQFQALMEGPHEQVLVELESERESVAATGGTSQVTTHDHTILAVRQVINLRDAKLQRERIPLVAQTPEGK